MCRFDSRTRYGPQKPALQPEGRGGLALGLNRIYRGHRGLGGAILPPCAASAARKGDPSTLFLRRTADEGVGGTDGQRSPARTSAGEDSLLGQDSSQSAKPIVPADCLRFHAHYG